MTLTGRELFFDKNDIIVSKTNTKGHITYANDMFYKISGYSEQEVLGQPHSFIRHPDMPRCVFKLLWETLIQGQEIFAYVVNRTKGGDHYWVLAHVTPSFDTQGHIRGYHSTRRLPNSLIVQNTIVPLYQRLCDIERSVPNGKDGMEKSFAYLVNHLDELGFEYDEFISSISQAA